MTDKQIRDIAAYWGAKCSYEREDTGQHTLAYLNKLGFIGATMLHNLQVEGFIRNLKLHLRPISSLTNEEWHQVFGHLFSGHECLRVERDTIAGIYWLSRNDLSVRIEAGPHYSGFNVWASCDYGDQSAAIEAGTIIPYLQSIGVYVPGSIDEEFVTIQP
ncbi:hypothetical protein GCM10028807_58090 [Spirosoma daeguense]